MLLLFASGCAALHVTIFFRAAGEPAPKKIKLDNDVTVEGGISEISKAKVTEV